MDKIIERIAKAPVGLKVGVVAAALAALTLLNYFVIGPTLGPSLSEVETRVRKATADQQVLDKDFIEKQAIANNLNQFRREKELMEQRLAEALVELPEDSRVDELLQLFQDRALKAGLEIVSIEPKDETPEGFYARIPIAMKVTGNYHEIATFIDSVGRLRRIVNVNELSLGTPKEVSGEMIIEASFIATAFRFVDSPAAAGAGRGARK